IEIAPDKVIRIVNWDKYQNIEGMERVREQNRKRAENHREKKKEEKKAAKSNKEETQKNEVLEENQDLDENKTIKEKKNSKDNDVLGENKTLNKNEALEISEKASTNTVIDDKTNTATSEEACNISGENANNNVETTDNNSNVTKNNSNVTQNESNVTVTVQNKKEIENKKKNKKEKKEIDRDKNIESNKNNTCDLNNKNLICGEDVNQPNLFEDNNIKSGLIEEGDINSKAMELMFYHEKVTGKPGGCEYVALRAAIEIYGQQWVKMAMDVGFEKNCPDIKYAIGVLKNWKRDGYTENDMEVKRNGFRGTGKSNTADKNEFAGFKPKEPRKLTEAERRRIEAKLI
ncbi:phage replisome organizer, partial [Clostridium chromiireducens]